MINIHDRIGIAFSTFDADKMVQCVRELLEQGVEVLDIVKGFTEALEDIGTKFEQGDIFLMHLVYIGMAAEKVLKEILEPEMLKTGNKRETLGKVVIGTVSGDIHEIGKNIVASLLFSAGYEVYDLGSDVSIDDFVKKVKEVNADILGMSALLTTTLPFQRTVIEELKKEGMRDRLKVIVGGAPVTKDWAKEIGADGYAENAIEAVKLVNNVNKMTEEMRLSHHDRLVDGTCEIDRGMIFIDILNAFEKMGGSCYNVAQAIAGVK